jgi:hypothetical protein
LAAPFVHWSSTSFATMVRAASATTAFNIMFNTTSASGCW